MSKKSSTFKFVTGHGLSSARRKKDIDNSHTTKKGNRSPEEGRYFIRRESCGAMPNVYKTRTPSIFKTEKSSHPEEEEDKMVKNI